MRRERDLLDLVPLRRDMHRRMPSKNHVGPDGEDAAALGPVLEFMRVLWGVDHQLQTASKRMLATRGVTGPQRLVLRIVALNPGISAGRLASILHLHPSTLTGVLRRLEERRLLRRAADAQDVRLALFELTP